MSHLWKSLGQKRTIAVQYEPNPAKIQYLIDMREATRMALAYALVDTRLNDGKIPSPCQAEEEGQALVRDVRNRLLVWIPLLRKNARTIAICSFD